MTDTIRELEWLSRMRADGAITEEEFAALKAKLLSGSPDQPSREDTTRAGDAPDLAEQKERAKTGAIVVGGIAVLAGLYMVGRWIMFNAVDLFTLTFIFFDIFGPLIAVVLIIRWINGLVDKLAKSRQNDRFS